MNNKYNTGVEFAIHTGGKIHSHVVFMALLFASYMSHIGVSAIAYSAPICFHIR